MSAKHTPAVLPEKPEGWTKRLQMHLNFGSAGGSAVYPNWSALRAAWPCIVEKLSAKATGIAS